MARAESQHVLNNGSYYAWMVCDYEMSGSTMSYTLWFHWDWGCAQLDNAWIKVGNTTIWSNGGRIHNYAASDIAQNHSCTIHSGSATIAGTQTVTFGVTKYEGVNLSGSFTVTGGTAPSTPTITVNSIADTSATFDVAVSSYGDPSAADGRYIEASILGQSTYGAPYKYAVSRNVSSDTIEVSNSSNGTLTIVPNTQYYYGAFASNTAMSSATVAGQIIMKPAYITGLTVTNDGQNNMSVAVQHASEGSAGTVTTEYSFDESTWVTASDSFTVTVNDPSTLYVRRSNSSGATPTYSVSITPVALVHLYGSVNGARKEIKHLYGSVNGSRKKIKKLYASVNGARKLIFRDDS